MATSTTVNDNNTTVTEDVTTTTTNATVNLNNSSGSDDVTTDGTGSTTINANNSTGADTFDIDNSGAATVNLNNSTGGDDVSINGTNVTATANLNNSAGNDAITIVGTSSTNATVNLNNSGGNDDVSIGSSTGATTATVNLNSSGGTDIINVTGLTTTATVNLANSTGADDLVELVGKGTGTINAVNSTGNDTLLGENSTDAITGGVGNDTVYLKGAGTINAGAGNDLGIYVLSDHYSGGSTLTSINGDVDYYYGQAGTNTLVLVLTPTQSTNLAVMSEITAYDNFLLTNPGPNQTFTFTFGASSGALVVAGWQKLVIQDTALGLTPVHTLVGSAGAATVEYVVSGIEEAGTGTLTLTDSGGGTTAETVTANGTFTFNLSGGAFGDGSVSSSLTFTDGIGNTFTASGTPVTLDKDTGDTATLMPLSTLIGSAGASAVSFTISGFDAADTGGAGNTGTVKFIEGTQTVTVGVTGDGTYTANLSTLADGTVSDSLAFTDVAGNTFTATGPTVTLDQDKTETVAVSPSLTLIGSAGAGAVRFVVTGLDTDDSGSLTLTDSGGGSTVLTVTGNATYTANLSGAGFGDGMVSSRLTVTDTAGNSFSASGTALTLDKDTGDTAALSLATTMIGSAGAAAVSFTISGFDAADTGGAGNTGTVKFIEGTQTVTVGVTGDGTYTANLSTLADGTVSDSLAFTDVAGNTFTATGPTVTLDQDKTETVAVSPPLTLIGSAGAGAVRFVVTGLDTDDSGSLTLTDSGGGSTVLTVTGNATYTANLSGAGFGDGTVSSRLTVTDTAGNSFSASGTAVTLDKDMGETASLSGPTLTLGSAGASAAAFVVTGLEADDSGRLVLSEGGSSETVSVTGNGTYTADLHTFADGTVSAALSITDTVGNSFSASTTVAVDPDFTETATLTGATITLGSAGASAAAFVVTGLEADDSGQLVLSEGGSSETVSVTGNGTYTADLHTFADGTVSAALSITDTVGNSFSASTTVAVDPDFTETATLTGATITLGSAGASAAAFVVTGLEADDSGQLVLSEGGSSETVSVTGNGTYTADLHTFADGTVSAALSITDTVGNSFSASTTVAVDPDFTETATLTGATITLGSAGASAAAFVVTGLEADDSGRLVLSEGGSSETVSVTGNGTYTADLHTFADGTVSAALSITDTVGNSFSASTTVAVDPDFTETATLTGATITLGSAGASAAAFVVTGLEADDSGQLVLSEGGSSETVSVTGNGTYTADLHTFADGTVSAALSITDTVGNSFSASTTVAVDPDFTETATLTGATITLGSAGASAAAFVVTGLEADDSGRLVLSEGGSSETVSVTGNGTYTADLHTFADGTVSAALSITDTVGNSFSASTTVAVDPDFTETATLTGATITLGSAGASAAAFVVTGLEADDSGQLVLSEGGSSETVSVTGNGTYTADLHTFADGTVSAALSITDTVGNSFSASTTVAVDPDFTETATLTGATITLGSAGASAAAFVVTGLEADDSGRLVLSEGGSSETVSVTGNGTYTADLHTFADGTVSAALSITDTVGNSFSASTTVAVDPDFTETATLTGATITLGSAGASAAAFVVTGLEADDSGRLVLSEGGSSETVSVTGNGTYTADLHTFADGTVSAALSITDTVGNSFSASTTVAVDPDFTETATLALGTTTIGSAGATAGSFTISGLDASDTGAGNTGTVSFVEAGSTVTVGVTGDGTYSANLSTLADGTVSDSLTFTDAVGNHFSATGPNVTLDKDTGDAAALSLATTTIGSAGAGAVSFTISGLDAADTGGAGNTGTVRFVEGGSTVTVGVTGDGTYSANLSTLADGTVSDSLAFTDVAGNTFTATGPSVTLDQDATETVSVSPSSTLIGSAGAGAVQFVVSGLSADDTGSLTLTDSGGGTTVLTVTGNATYMANLSSNTFGDGTVSSSLTVTDTAGNSFSANGTAVTLDKDTTETVAVSPVSTLIGSASAGAVKFVVSGIGADDGGSLTLTDSGGGSTVLGVTANGTYTANLSGVGFGDGTVSSSLTVTDTANNTFTANGTAVTLDKDTGDTAALSLATTTIGSAGAGAVSFTISGLDAADTGGAGNTGTVSFVEGTQTVTVGVTGDGTYSANLSTLVDGTVSDSLAFTDVAGNTFTATGPSVTLDKDTGETATLSFATTTIGSAGASAVSFTISGLDSGDVGAGNTAIVTFVDAGSTITSTVVPTATSGIYTANLSTLADGNVTTALTLTDAAGNIIPVKTPLQTLTLDQDKGETATLAFANASTTETVGAETATFTISGLEAEDVGRTETLVFSETGQPAETFSLAPTATSGTYSEVLGFTTAGTVGASLTFTDPAGNAFSAQSTNSVTLVAGPAPVFSSLKANSSSNDYTSVTGSVADAITGTITLVLADPTGTFTATTTVVETTANTPVAFSIPITTKKQDNITLTAYEVGGQTASHTGSFNSFPAGISGDPINLALTDPAAGESVTVTVSDVPTGWSLNGGTNNNGTWTVVTTDPSTLAVTTPATSAGAAVLAINESWTNPDGSTGSASVADNVEAYPASPIFAVSGDDTLTGAGANDEFVFAQPIGNDTVYNFNAASDQIDLIGFGISGFAALQGSIADDANGNAVVTLGQNETITLVGIDAAALSASNFVFDQEPVTTNTGTMSVGDGAMLPLGGTIDNTGTIAIGSTGDESDLEILVRGATLQGGGQVVLSDNSQNVVFGGDPSAVLTNVDNTISGAGQLGNGQLTLDNEGTIDATGTNALVIDTGANTLTNSGTLEATGAGGLDIKSALANSGTLWANGGNVTVEGAETGGGTAEISGSAQLEFSAASDAAVSFDATATGTLKLDQSANFSGTVAGLGQGDSLDLADIAFGSGTTLAYTANAAGTGGTLTVSDGTHTANLALLGQYAAAGFQTSADQGAGTVVIYSPQVAQQTLLTNPQQHA